MFLDRTLKASIDRALAQFPAVLVTGPRQSGKSTLLLKRFSAGADYVTLDDPLERAFARDDPNGFLDRFAERRVILDEIQYAPELLSYLKIRIDQDRRRNGRWLLTGSQQFHLMAQVGESLAGRVAILELPPFSLSERPQTDLPAAIWQGGYPEPALHPEKRDLWLQSYVRTYVERDVRQLHNISDLAAFETFLAFCASRHGQELVMSDIARSVGISQPTVKIWLGVLEASYLVVLVRPYFENFGKRLVKSPKLYFLDSALVAYLTRQPSAEAALHGAMGGALFEGLIVSEAFKAYASRGQRPELYHWRTHNGLEVDLLLRHNGRLLPVEIKLTSTPAARHVKPLSKLTEILGEKASSGLLVCRVDQERTMPGGQRAISWSGFPQLLTG